MSGRSIELRDLAYALPEGRALFSGISATIGNELVGLVGANGAGKTTLLRIIAAEIAPIRGTVSGAEQIGYMPQEASFVAGLSVGMALGLGDVEGVLQRLKHGVASAADIEAASDYWERLAQARSGLAELGLDYLEVEKPVDQCSGGERTRLSLLRVMLRNPSHLALDEPTNHLDAQSRAKLRDTLLKWNGGAIVVSHDRRLLADMDRIFELDETGLTAYGGGFDFYQAQRELARAAAARRLHDAEREVTVAKRSARQNQEKQERRAAAGRSKARHTGMSSIEVGAAKERAGQSAKRRSGEGSARLEAAVEQARAQRANVPPREQLSFALHGARAPARRHAVDVSGLSFAYPGAQRLFAPVSFSVPATGRIAIEGPSGAGKSTLLKILAGTICGYEGSVAIGARRPVYLEQRCEAMFDPEATILESFKRHNPAVSGHEARTRLARFLFRNQDALKRVASLSGGEKLRAALACVLMAEQPSDLLLLDEPTNNLDLPSIAYLEEALASHRAALVAVSHDFDFLERIGIQERVRLLRPVADIYQSTD